MGIEYYVYCLDCKVYMELGKFLFQDGRFTGPFILGMDKVVASDVALWKFLEEHNEHRIGIKQDVYVDDAIQKEFVQVVPSTEYCVTFEVVEVNE